MPHRIDYLTKVSQRKGISRENPLLPEACFSAFSGIFLL
jgi:hypothetical protein